MKKQSLALTLTLCLGLGAFSSCTPSQMSANPTGVSQTAVQPGQSAAQSLSLQAALANYHEVDASFSDTQRLARSGQFQTKLLGGILDSDDEDDNSGSGLLDDVLGSGSNNGSSSSNTNLGVGVNANVDANLDSSNHSGSSNSGSSSNTGLGVGVDANVDANLDNHSGSGSSSNTGLNLGVDANVDANVDASNHSGSSTGSTGATATGSTGATGTGSTGSSGSNSSQANTSLDLNLDAETMLGLFDDEDFNETSLQTDLRARLNLDAQSQDSDDDDSSRIWTQINADALARLSSRNYNNNSWSSDNQTMADGSVQSNFYTRFQNSDSQRNVTMSDINSQANAHTTFKLQERGSNFTRNASRRSELMADGSVRVMTTTTTNYSNGDRLEIFEDRNSSAQGAGTGNGTYTMTHSDGSQESGDLRTMVTADGSLTSYLDSEDEDFMLREDAQGRGSLSIRDQDGWDDSWTQVDFNAMLNSMTRLSAND